LKLLSFISFISLILADPPDWEDCYGCYELTASITAVVLIDGDSELGDDGDILAAFDVDSNVRGIGAMLDGLGNYTGVTLHAIMIRSNQDGDEISFRYYDASYDVIYDLEESYNFVINDLAGNLMAPYTLSYENMSINDGLLPLNYVLQQNYPNPYNPKTFINYTVSDLSNVTLRIYDIKGQLIIQLLNDIHTPGIYETIWDSGHLATGMYLLEMKAHSIIGQLIFQDINKMLFLK